MRTAIVTAMQTHDDFALATWRIRRLMPGKPPARNVRAELVRMEGDGIVRKTPHSTVNNTVWQLVHKDQTNG